MSTNAGNVFAIAQAKHSRQLNRLTERPVAQWKDSDFTAINASRAERDAAAEKLPPEQHAKHFGKPDKVRPVVVPEDGLPAWTPALPPNAYLLSEGERALLRVLAISYVLGVRP